MRALELTLLVGSGLAIGVAIWWPPTEDAPSNLDAPITPPARPSPRRGAHAVNFAELAGFEFEFESGAVLDAIEAFRGKVVEVIGVMYFSVEDPDQVAEFYLMPDQMVCCFGTPRINQIVDVRLPKGVSTRYTLDYYLIRGVLEIGPFHDDDGLALCLYRVANAEVEFLA